MTLEQNKNQAMKYLDDNSEIFAELSHFIWDNPELSLKEFKAADAYAKALAALGFEVSRDVCGIETAVSGSFGSGAPVIAFLGEFDALSELSQTPCGTKREPQISGGNGHGCGHNMLGAGSLAAAAAAADYLKKSGASGTVIFYGCPGEEGGAAKAFMAREGIFYNLDAALSWHPGDVNEVRTGTNNSSLQVLYTFKGISSHAADSPEHGRSGLDAAELMNIGVQYLREHMKSECRVHYAMISSGGCSPNVVQPEASVLYMVRAVAVRDSLDLLERVDKIAQGAALMTETVLHRQFIDGTANLVPNFTIEKLLQENLLFAAIPDYTPQELDFAKTLTASYDSPVAPGAASKFDSAIAEWVREKTDGMSRVINDFIMPEYHGEGFTAGSTDVGDVSWQCPTSQINAVCFPSGCPGHSWQMVSCGRSSIGDKGLLFAGKVLACTAIDLFENSDKLSAAKAEFERRTRDGYLCPVPEGVAPIALEC